MHMLEALLTVLSKALGLFIAVVVAMAGLYLLVYTVGFVLLTR